MHFLSGAYRFGTANGNTLGVAMSEDPPEAIASARCASPGGGSGVEATPRRCLIMAALLLPVSGPTDQFLYLIFGNRGLPRNDHR